ncbi:YkgJ family cysteine cluster protein [Methanolobus halotolerans]|uniref:YkgJ family cysteine cluster protein n=1 Tax=Methanolobus halotolerans TaxID=2052935 RepID=A0A4E0R1F9_9EURY|nr:YkgJ family cysteine cluster protein [Methanolobus halotolerans]TGC11009.1 YkgJ family cysteine cluster protein [Methanolobus halotolerans]
MEISAAVKKAIRYDVVQNILRHYECPDTCGAHCCSKGQIHLFEDELKLLTVLDPVKSGVINKDISPGLYLMNAPCSFLNETGRCEVYSKRPIVCGLYPFKVNTSGNSIGLQPCPVGFLIIRDFASWVMDSILKTGLSEQEKLRISEEWQRNIDSYASELTEFHFKTVLKEMQIPFDELEMLSMFLASTNSQKMSSVPATAK